MAITFVQQKTGSTENDATPLTVTFDNPVVTGNSVVCLLSYLSTDVISEAALVGSVSDGLGAGPSATVAGVGMSMFYSHITDPAITGVRFAGDGDTRLNVVALEFGGLSSADPEAVNSSTGVLNAAPVTGSVTPTSANSLLIAGGAWTLNKYFTGPVNSFIRLTSVGGGVVFQESGYKIESVAAAYSTGWTLSDALANWVCVIAAFGAPGVSVGVPSGLALLGVGK